MGKTKALRQLQEVIKQFGGPRWSAWLESTRARTPATARVYFSRPTLIGRSIDKMLKTR